MKTTTKQPKTPRPRTTDGASPDTSARFQKLVAGGRGKKGTTAPTEEPTTDATPAPVNAAVEATIATAAGPAPEPAAPFATLGALGAGYAAYQRANGASLSTQASYQTDFVLAAEVLGPERDPASITAAEIAAFEQHARVLTTKGGKPKSPLTIAKTRRVLRLAYAYARDNGRVAATPYAAATTEPSTAA